MAEKFVFPAGKYYIGDPAYVVAHLVTDAEWITICNEIEENKIYHYDGKICWANYTRYGDGIYHGGGHSYAVDSGLIGIVPVDEDFDISKFFAYDVDGAIKVFKRKFHVWEENGIFHIGGIIIHT